MALLRPPILPLLLILLSALHAHNVALVSAEKPPSSSPIRCASGWSRSNKLQTIPPERINDGYCDCPLDGLDEVETGACSGSIDGMWAGIPPSSIYGGGGGGNSESSDYMFVCQQQPSLRLPPSRINDGICDCCDGADERQSEASASSCPNICDAVLASEREARMKLQKDFIIGSETRLSSIQQFQKWHEEMQIKIQKISDKDNVVLEQRLQTAEQALSLKRVDLVKMWTLTVDEVLSQSVLYDIVSNEQVMTAENLGLFIMSLCQLSGEVSADQVVNGVCLPFDRASLDVGIIWDDNNDNVPSFNIFDARTEQSIADYAEKLVIRLDETKTDTAIRTKQGTVSFSDESQPEHDMYDYDDDYHEYHSEDDDYTGHSGDDERDYIGNRKHDESNLGNISSEDFSKELSFRAVRDAFKEHAAALLASSEVEEKEGTDGAIEEENDVDAVDAVNTVDPMALRMARSTISKRLGNIERGETSSRSVSSFVKALTSNDNSILELEDLQSLAIMTIYHSKLSVEDVSEIIYNLMLAFEEQEDRSDQSCSSVASSSFWCPPVTVASQQGAEGSYPPPLIVKAAERRCSQRADVDVGGICSGEGKEAVFPLSVPDGYYGYYEPQLRQPNDALSPLFESVASPHIPEDLTNAKKVALQLDKKLASSKRELKRLKDEVDGSNDSKYGIDGELFIMRDTCHKIESGKYEYEVCIFGKATQRDIGTNGRGTSLGSWDKVQMNNGQRTLKWNNGDKCWNGPHRSAEVIVTCGGTTKILSGDEPETCRYVFEMESPIACDDQFKVNNAL